MVDNHSWSDHDFVLAPTWPACLTDVIPVVSIIGVSLEMVYRVLKPRGSFVILNFSSRGAPDIDCVEVEQLARQQHFEILENGARPFRI